MKINYIKHCLLLLIIFFECGGVRQSFADIGCDYPFVPACDCYYSQDCPGGGPLGDHGKLCDIGESCCASGKLDGVCEALIANWTDEDVLVGVSALDLWLKAYIAAGANGGGPPDSVLINQAESLGLTTNQQDDIRKIALYVQYIYLGLHEYTNTPVFSGVL